MSKLTLLGSRNIQQISMPPELVAIRLALHMNIETVGISLDKVAYNPYPIGKTTIIMCLFSEIG